MIQKTKTREGILLEDDESGESVQLDWSDVGELLTLIGPELEELGRLELRNERPAELLARAIKVWGS